MNKWHPVGDYCRSASDLQLAKCCSAFWSGLRDARWAVELRSHPA
ncbi:hypothetical protein [Rubritalea tangerina]